MAFDSFLRQVGLNLRTARWQAGMTQEELASHGFNLRHYQDVERGRANPTLQTLVALARVLGTTVAAVVDVNPGATATARERLALGAERPPIHGRKARLRARTKR